MFVVDLLLTSYCFVCLFRTVASGSTEMLSVPGAQRTYFRLEQARALARFSSGNEKWSTRNGENLRERSKFAGLSMPRHFRAYQSDEKYHFARLRNIYYNGHNEPL
jgi:hypothetical protein